MASRRLTTFARNLRKGSTDAERKIWRHLRERGLAGHIFRRQHPIAGYIADFYCHAAQLIVELDGGQHLDPQGIARDKQRAEAIGRLGVEVIRFSDIDALKEPDVVLETILRAVEQRVKARSARLRVRAGDGKGD